ncbi:MAG: phosphopantetheine-binding protein, partial [Candidatus Accumulibacter sp.]|nr:phosphopantetheine-binding protein [Accumulibacter sp.]
MNPEQTFAELFNMAQTLFGMREEDLDPDAGILELGLDSLMIIRFGQEIEQRWGVQLETAWFFAARPSLKTLADKVGAEAVPGASTGSHHGNQNADTVIASPAAVPPVSSIPAAPIFRQSDNPAAPGPDATVQLCVAQLQSMHELFARQLEAFARGSAASAQPPLAPPAAPLQERSSAPRPPRGFILKAADLTREQADFVAELASAHLAKTRRSRDKSRSSPVLADWKSTLTYRPELQDVAYPIVADRMAGGKFIDIDGNEYIDIAVGMGVHFLGHNPPYVEEAIRRRLDKGFGLGPQCDLTAIAAERIGALTGMERV